MKKAEMRNLLNIVKVRRLTMRGRILRLPPDRPEDWAVANQWIGLPHEGKRRRRRPSNT